MCDTKVGLRDSISTIAKNAIERSNGRCYRDLYNSHKSTLHGIQDLAVKGNDDAIKKLTDTILNYRINNSDGDADYGILYQGCLIAIATIAGCAPNIDASSMQEVVLNNCK